MANKDKKWAAEAYLRISKDKMPLDESERERTISCTSSIGATAPRCPACGGALVPIHTAWRCSRCYFSLCAGCESVLITDPAEEE